MERRTFEIGYYYTTEDIAGVFGIKVKSIYDKIRSGKLQPQIKVNGRLYFSESYVAQKVKESKEKKVEYCNKDLCIYRGSCLLTDRFYNNWNGCSKYEKYTVEHYIRGVG